MRGRAKRTGSYSVRTQIVPTRLDEASDTIIAWQNDHVPFDHIHSQSIPGVLFVNSSW
jgi:hypothetical protein